MVLKRVQQQSTNSTCSATMADRAVLKLVTFHGLLYLRSVTMADQAVLKQGHGGVPDQNRSATMADQAVLKLLPLLEIGCCVQQPWQIRRFSNLWVWICRLNWAFLFQRTAKSARSSCFCDPPGRFFDRALGSPQASIPAPTAVWIHCSKLAFECEYTKRLLTE